MAPQMPRRRRQPGESGDKLFAFHALPAEPMEVDPNLERDRATARGVQTPDSRPRPCRPAMKPPPCCSGRCSPPARLPCAKSTAGRASPKSQTIRSLTSPHDRIASCRPKTRQPIPTQVATAPAASARALFALSLGASSLTAMRLSYPSLATRGKHDGLNKRRTRFVIENRQRRHVANRDGALAVQTLTWQSHFLLFWIEP